MWAVTVTLNHPNYPVIHTLQNMAQTCTHVVSMSQDRVKHELFSLIIHVPSELKGVSPACFNDIFQCLLRRAQLAPNVLVRGDLHNEHT